MTIDDLGPRERNDEVWWHGRCEATSWVDGYEVQCAEHVGHDGPHRARVVVEWPAA